MTILAVHNTYSAVIAAQSRLIELRERLKEGYGRDEVVPAKIEYEKAIKRWSGAIRSANYQPQEGEREVTLWVNLARGQAERCRDRIVHDYPEINAKVQPWRLGRIDVYSISAPNIVWCVVVRVAHPMDAMALDLLIDRRSI